MTSPASAVSVVEQKLPQFLHALADMYPDGDLAKAHGPVVTTGVKENPLPYVAGGLVVILAGWWLWKRSLPGQLETTLSDTFGAGKKLLGDTKKQITGARDAGLKQIGKSVSESIKTVSTTISNVASTPTRIANVTVKAMATASKTGDKAATAAVKNVKKVEDTLRRAFGR